MFHNFICWRVNFQKNTFFFSLIHSGGSTTWNTEVLCQIYYNFCASAWTDREIVYFNMHIVEIVFIWNNKKTDLNQSRPWRTDFESEKGDFGGLKPILLMEWSYFWLFLSLTTINYPWFAALIKERLATLIAIRLCQSLKNILFTKVSFMQSTIWPYCIRTIYKWMMLQCTKIFLNL